MFAGTPVPVTVCPMKRVPAVGAEAVSTVVAKVPENVAFVTGAPDTGEDDRTVGKPKYAGDAVNWSCLPDSSHENVSVIPDACTLMLGKPIAELFRMAVCSRLATSRGVLPDGAVALTVCVPSLAVKRPSAGSFMIAPVTPFATALTGLTFTEIGCPLSAPAVLKTIGRPRSSVEAPEEPIPPAFPA